MLPRELLELLWVHVALQPCGERVLMTLAHQYRDFVVPLLQTTFQQIVGVCESLVDHDQDH